MVFTISLLFSTFTVLTESARELNTLETLLHVLLAIQKFATMVFGFIRLLRCNPLPVSLLQQTVNPF